MKNRKTLNQIVVEEVGFEEPLCLQCLGLTFEQMGSNPEQFAEEIKEYEAETNNRHPLSFPLAKNPIEALIDKQTGFAEQRGEAVYNYAAWFIKEYGKGFNE